MTMHGGWSGPDVAGTSAVVAALSLRAGSTETDVTSDCADECEAWDSGYQREIIDGVIHRSRIGMIRMISLVENMWINIIFICWR